MSKFAIRGLVVPLIFFFCSLIQTLTPPPNNALLEYSASSMTKVHDRIVFNFFMELLYCDPSFHAGLFLDSDLWSRWLPSCLPSQHRWIPCGPTLLDGTGIGGDCQDCWPSRRYVYVPHPPLHASSHFVPTRPQSPLSIFTITTHSPTPPTLPTLTHSPTHPHSPTPTLPTPHTHPHSPTLPTLHTHPHSPTLTLTHPH